MVVLDFRGRNVSGMIPPQKGMRGRFRKWKRYMTEELAWRFAETWMLTGRRGAPGRASMESMRGQFEVANARLKNRNKAKRAVSQWVGQEYGDAEFTPPYPDKESREALDQVIEEMA